MEIFLQDTRPKRQGHNADIFFFFFNSCCFQEAALHLYVVLFQLYECGVHKYVPEITGENAESFRFNLLQFVKQEMLADGGGVQLADGGWLIPSDDWTAGKEEFYRY